jgi:TIGR00255 family protein
MENMIKSMTGFGRGEYEENGRSFTVEVKTVNHRYSDISIRLPRQLSYLEDTIRKYISRNISRGKIDVYISQDKYNEDEVRVSIDHALTSSYVKALNELRNAYKLEDDITVSVVARFPDILTVDRVEEDKDKIWNTLSMAIDKSMNELMTMREIEGRKLADDVIERAGYIRSIVKQIEERSPQVVQEYKSKLEDRIKQLLDDVPVDEARIAVEVALFADKSSIAEEIVRLYSHLDQLLSIMNENEPVGRKLDFLIQEMNREINTIGSKANDIMITKQVVVVKSEIEKIREQIQNIE